MVQWLHESERQEAASAGLIDLGRGNEKACDFETAFDLYTRAAEMVRACVAWRACKNIRERVPPCSLHRVSVATCMGSMGYPSGRRSFSHGQLGFHRSALEHRRSAPARLRVSETTVRTRPRPSR
jgi:hypothetical protein